MLDREEACPVPQASRAEAGDLRERLDRVCRAPLSASSQMDASRRTHRRLAVRDLLVRANALVESPAQS